MKTQTKWNVVIKLSALTLSLMLSLTAVSVADDKTPETANSAKPENQAELKCKVSGNDIKLVTMTNQTDRVIAKGTAINFDPNTGIETTKSLRKNLKPGRTTIVHLGRFVGNSCLCRLVQ